MAKEPQTIRLRHYTRVSSLRRMLAEGRIIARDQNKVFVERADRKPLSRREAENRYLMDRGKGYAYIEFDALWDEVGTQGNPRFADAEWYIRGDVDLSDRRPEGFINR